MRTALTKKIVFLKMETENYYVINCNVPCCHGQHYIKFINGKAVIPTWDFFEIVRHYEKNIANLCGPVCSSNSLCRLHKKLNCLHFFSEYIRDKNINSNIIVAKILIKNCLHPFRLNGCCFLIYETKYMKDCSMSMTWRSRYL